MKPTRALVYLVVRIAFVVAAIVALLRADYEAMAIAFIGLAASVVPQLIVRRLQLKLPLFYEMTVLGFIVASLLLGEFLGAYARFDWWDSMLHLSSGVIIGYIGYMILFTLYLQGRLHVSAGMIAFLTFSVSMMVAVMWEIVEFAIDETFGSTMQHGNTDTMKDMILAMIGSLVATAAAYWHHRWPESSPLRDELRGFFERNTHLVPSRSHLIIRKSLGRIKKK